MKTLGTVNDVVAPDRCWRLVILLPFLLLLTLPSPAGACGWWGDGEMDQSDDAIEVDASGRPLAPSADLKSMKLPGRMGYGIAVPEPARAMPYLLATFGQPVNSIGELETFGFRSVIDLATPASVARLHRAETEAAGMRYYNVPIEGEMPAGEQSSLFKRIVVNADNGPLLVYAPKAEMLAVMWTSYRINTGSPMEFALMEGRALGLTANQETKLRIRERQSKTKKKKE